MVTGIAATIFNRRPSFLMKCVLWLLGLFAVEALRSTAWSTFRFASNGVCVEPQRFAHTSSDERQDTFTLRNVPGQGDCMFQAVALASFASVGLGANNVLLQAITKELRSLTASLLEESGNLVIEGSRIVSCKALLASAAKQEGLSTENYLSRLRKEGVEGGLYGGGPELTALCNLLRRPISIYELVETTVTDSFKGNVAIDPCPIACKGTFGDVFSDPLGRVPDSAVLNLSHSLLPGAYSWHLHILVVPTSPVEKHACVLLPQDSAP
jgi:hypothetical protein